MALFKHPRPVSTLSQLEAYIEADKGTVEGYFIEKSRDLVEEAEWEETHKGIYRKRDAQPDDKAETAAISIEFVSDEVKDKLSIPPRVIEASFTREIDESTVALGAVTVLSRHHIN